MPLLIVQLAVLIAIAFVVGCLLGRLVRRKKPAIRDNERTIIAAALATPPVDEKPEKPEPSKTVSAATAVAKPETPVETDKAEAAKKVPDAEVVGGELPLRKGEAEPAAETGQPQLLEAPRQGKADDLTAIHGIGRAVEAILNRLGVFHYDQISGWSDDESRWIEQVIGFPGRVERENWRVQAARFVSASAKGRTRKAEKPKKVPARAGTRRTKRAPKTTS